MDDHFLKFIWRYSRRQQVGIGFLTLLAFPLLYMTLEIPKWIINRALGDSESSKILFGFYLTPVEYLGALCIGLMVLVILSGLLKMRINTYKGIIGERLIRRLRFSLIARLLRFPLSHYSSVSPGEMISTVSSETEPLAGYIGESIALPLFQGGTMVTILIFMFAQNWVFGMVSVVLIPVQGYLIPKLQRQINLLKKDRIRRVRLLSERIGETVVGASEIRLHGTEKYTLAEFSRRFGDLFWVRLEILQKKFYMKFLNNTIGQVTPFLYYLFGGYLVIQGNLTVGALVAAIVGCAVTIGFGAVVNDAAIRPGQSVAIWGIGGVGISAILGAVSVGAEYIIAVDPNPRKEAAADQFGATHYINPQQTDNVPEAIRELTQGRGVDPALDCIGNVGAFEHAFRSTRPAGAVVSVGQAAKDIDFVIPGARSFPVYQKRIIGSYYGGGVPERDFRRILGLYKMGKLDLDSIIGKTVPLGQINEAFRELESGIDTRTLIGFDH